MAAPVPSFVIIGAPKSATSWLVGNLRAQSEIFMPSQELHFFNRNYERGFPWYLEHFRAAEDGQTIGEKSASYLADPRVPHRLAAALPRARLIVQLRNPVDRAYSDYCMLLRRGEVSADIDRYLEPGRAELPRFLEDGLYAHYLRGFLERFPRERIKIVLYDDIRRDPAGVFTEVADFIGAGGARVNAFIERRVKDRTVAMLPLPLRRVGKPFKRLVAPYRSQPWFERTRALFARPVSYPPLDDELRLRLQDYYAEDVAALAELLGRGLGVWTDPKEARR